jgi:hypothetical protein
VHQTGHPLENCRCQKMNFLFTKLFDCYCFNFRNLKGLHMFVKMFKLCLCESGKNFQLCLCKFFNLPPFVSKCHTLPKVFSDGPSNRQQTCFKVLQIGGGGGGGGGGRGDRSLGRGCRVDEQGL